MNRAKWLILAESATVFVLVMLYIWRLRYTTHEAWIYILVFLLLSHYMHKERAAGLGFRWSNFEECVDTLAPAVLLFALSMIAVGVLLQTLRNITLDRCLLCFAAYCPWGLFQQYLLNAYFANRLLTVSSARHVPLITAALFSGAHVPNWFLMLVTFASGYCATRVYMKYRNVYFLGLAHGVIGSVLFMVIPDSISHHLTVGPGFFLR
jgi:hypothetical protein